MRSTPRRTRRVRPRPAPPPPLEDPRLPIRDLLQVRTGWEKLCVLAMWALLSAGIVLMMTLVVWLSLVGDWDEPQPPNPIAAWSVALFSMAAVTLAGWLSRVRVVRCITLAALPLQFAWWLFLIPRAGLPN